MQRCAECNSETAESDLLFDAALGCSICRGCFVGALVGSENEAAKKAGGIMFKALRRLAAETSARR